MLLIHKASAGSGKTFSLAREYLMHILGQKREDGTYRLRRKGESGLHRRILAITFTNKATEEMKGRIIHELALLAGLEPGWDNGAESPHLAVLSERLHATPAQIAEASRTALKELLFDFNDFNVSTIDSFFQSVLRAFAHEADVSGSYNVELDDREVIERSVDTLLQDLNHADSTDAGSRELMRWLTLFMTKKIEEGTAFNIFNRTSGAFEGLISFVDSITDDTYRKHERGILEYLGSGRFEEFRKGLEEQNSKLRARAKRICGDALSAIATAGAEDMVQRNILNPLRVWAESGFGSAPSATVQKCAADIAAAYKKPKRKSDPQPPREALDGPISEALDAIISTHAELSYITLLRNNVYYLGLLSFVSSYMRRFRLENSTILLSDTNALLSAIIGDSDSPFLYEKIGTRFENYLIDEFQDTSFSQWHNLEPLVRESAANGGDNLVIGDEKQSIYRFRGSDSTLLHNLDTTMGDVETEVRGTRIEENTNWRSSVEVIQFNNTLFTAMSGLAGVGDIYDSVAQHVSPKNYAKHGYVAMRMTKAGPNDRETYVPAALEFMASNLRRQLESGYRPGDIAILVRRRSEGEEAIAYLQELQAEDPTFPSFNIVSDQSFLVSRSPAVRLVVSTLRYLTALEFNPRRHKRSRKEVARVQTDFEARYAESETASQSLEEALAALEARRNAEAEVPEPIEAKAIESVDLFSLVEEIIHTIPAKRRAEEAVFITAFQDMVADFINHGNSDIRAFLQWWDERGSNISVAGAEDPTAIKVLTMHKSKGLEFPCVHVPFAALAQTGGAGRDRAWFRVPPVDGIPAEIQPELMPLEIVSAMASTPLAGEYAEIQKKRQLDFLNLLYVALTRAVDELIVSVRTQESDGTGPELPINRLIMGGIAKADSGFCALCEADVTLRPGEPSPFITLADKLDGDTLTIGDPTHRKAEQKKPRPVLEPEEGESIADYRSSEARNPWKHTRVDHERVNAVPTARERGLIFHYILSQILTVDDIPSAFARARASQPDEVDVDGMRRIFEKSLEDPLVAKWFAPSSRVLMEREALTRDGRIKRFDRVVWTRDGELHLIDFKTGGQDPKVYRKAMREYVDFFKSAGYLSVRAFLFFLDKGEIIEML